MTTIGADEIVIQEITIKAPAKRIFEALTNPGAVVFGPRLHVASTHTCHCAHPECLVVRSDPLSPGRAPDAGSRGSQN